MSEYVDIAYTVTLSVHFDDIPTPGELCEALWDGLPNVYDHSAIRVERVPLGMTASCFIHGDFDAALDRCPKCQKGEV
jgi:hypothetical protein